MTFDLIGLICNNILEITSAIVIVAFIFTLFVKFVMRVLSFINNYKMFLIIIYVNTLLCLYYVVFLMVDDDKIVVFLTEFLYTCEMTNILIPTVRIVGPFLYVTTKFTKIIVTGVFISIVLEFMINFTKWLINKITPFGDIVVEIFDFYIGLIAKLVDCVIWIGWFFMDLLNNIVKSFVKF